MVSIFCTSQKFKTFPTALRAVTNLIISFQLTRLEFESMKKELIYTDVPFEEYLQYIFNSEGDTEGTSNNSFLIYNINSNKFYKEFELIN